jgi:acyl-coenzyme A synthetase/AMP-(fatty) acid ligase
VFSPEHISGIETVLSIIAPGGTIYFPENRDALTIAENISKNQVNLLACTPTFLKLIYLTHAFELYDLSSLQIINYGAERMDKQLLKTLQLKLSHTHFYQAFGTTETTNIRTYTLADTDYFKPGVEGQDYIIKDGQLFLKLSQM